MILKDKNVVITGSGRGIGKHIALLCAREGANIGLTSRTLSQLNNARKEIENVATGVKLSAHAGDITDLEKVKTIFKKFYEELGPLNAVVANAGWRDSQPSLTYDLEIFRRIIDINIMGVYYSFRASFPYLKMDDKKDKARFIITGSTQFLRGAPLYLPYSIAKFGVVGLINSLSMEFKKQNITFNMVLPQRVDTYLTRGDKAEDSNKPAGFLSPWDISDYYLFLLSEQANKYNYKLLNTFDFETTKKIISEAPTDKRNNLNVFLEYLKEKNIKIYQNVKDFSKFVEFLLLRHP
ncbi:MAG: SDR family NAD(P)-dependent oxidoreductase [Promethearchaeota archaeon]|jgi:3-oxoacyl-[acyl-carrier protein] reductase